MITNNAKGIISIIAFEVRLQDERVRGGHIDQGQVAGMIYERLLLKAKTNVDLKNFLTTMAFIPASEDERLDVDWAEDKREARNNVITDREHEEEVGFPMPGERIC